MNANADSPACGEGAVPEKPIQFTGKLACIKCDYDLRGLALEGPCPECGAPIAETWHRDMLRFADLVWLKRVRLGLRLIVASFVVPFLVTIPAGIAGGPLIVRSGDSVISRTIQFTSIGILCALGLAVLVAYSVGIWLATEPNPAASMKTERAHLARARWSGVLVPFIGAAGLGAGCASTSIDDHLALRACFLVALLCVLYLLCHLALLGPVVSVISKRGVAATRRKTLAVRRSGWIKSWRVFRGFLVVCAVIYIALTVWALVSLSFPASSVTTITSILMIVTPIVCHGAAASNMSETTAVVSYELQFGTKLGDRREAIREASPTLESLD
ncbi:MAG: hypothetical protein D8M59_13765 [Planctomycetes bacterium]|nr:hypothetical protein [Planctomycetota bacterium]NOG55575.1 hypothetical protein [Planctomycetota bacterium]